MPPAPIEGVRVDGDDDHQRVHQLRRMRAGGPEYGHLRRAPRGHRRGGFASMARMIPSESINCGAGEPECPNTAIYQGAVDWQEPDGAMHAGLSNEIFYIVPEKCTECVGFHDHEACAAVCPVDC